MCWGGWVFGFVIVLFMVWVCWMKVSYWLLGDYRGDSNVSVLLWGLVLGFGFDEGWFVWELMVDFMVLFCIFYYLLGDERDWGVGEYIDYGLFIVFV